VYLPRIRNQRSLYLIVAAKSALAAVDIAAPPNFVGSDATIAVPANTVTPTSTIAVADVLATTEVVTATTEPPVVRADVVIVAINGARVSGLAGRPRDELIALGYGNARSADGTTIAEETKVYYFGGLERAATDVAPALELDPTRVQP
jgi:hypothetical protein